jgi:hypothetical protein
VSFEFIETTVYLAVVECFGALADALEKERLGIDFGIHAEDIEGNSRCCTIVTTSNDVAVTDNEDELAFVVVVEGGKRVDRSAEGILAFRVTGNLAKYELILKLRVALSTELQCSQDYEGMKVSES